MSLSIANLHPRRLLIQGHLKAKGKAFYPVVMALRAWGETWCKSPGEGLAVVYTHEVCGQPAGLGPLCAHCGELLRREGLAKALGEAYSAERQARREASKGRAQRA